MFLTNHWYAAAWSDEVGRTPLARTLLNKDVVLFRKLDGTAVALENRCAHRRLPLSMGSLIGDTLQCRYHGLVYDCSGNCVHIPGQVIQLKGKGVRLYPLIENHKLLWLWTGEPKLADPATIPAFNMIDDPAWTMTTWNLLIRANYLLVLDNLLELSHVAYVHARNIGNEAVAEKADVKVSRHGTRVRITREMIDVSPPKTYVDFGPHKDHIDRWQVAEFSPPCYFFVNNGTERTDAKSANRFDTQGEWGFRVYHALTPVSEKSTYQFTAVVHEKSKIPENHRAGFYEQQNQVIHEDLDVYEAQQISLDTERSGASAENVNSSIAIEYDRGFMQARRIINELLSEERSLRKSTDSLIHPRKDS